MHEISEQLKEAQKKCEQSITEAINEFLQQSGSINVDGIELTSIDYQVSKQMVIGVKVKLMDNAARWSAGILKTEG